MKVPVPLERVYCEKNSSAKRQLADLAKLISVAGAIHIIQHRETLAGWYFFNGTKTDLLRNMANKPKRGTEKQMQWRKQHSKSTAILDIPPTDISTLSQLYHPILRVACPLLRPDHNPSDGY